jgi:LmbE family N-acetylglucosaminyl deacetylase
MKILIVASHPDDEVLGMGGTIKKLSKKNSIILCIVSEGTSAQYSDQKMIEIRKNACLKSGKLLGFPDQKLDSISNLQINQFLEKIVSKHRPDIVFTTPNNDLNNDHLIVHNSTLVATRPLRSSVKRLLSYEIPGYTKTSFHPNVFEDISKELKYKINAFKIYKSEIEKFPYPRSIEAIRNLSIYRGLQSGFKNAESFILIRSNSI